MNMINVPIKFGAAGVSSIEEIQGNVFGMGEGAPWPAKNEERANRTLLIGNLGACNAP